MSLKQELEKIQQLDRESYEAETESKKRLEELRKNIKEGGTTGDSIQDFIIVTFGKYENKRIREKIERICDKVKKHAGEQILVVNHWRDNNFDEPCRSYQEMLRLGVIDGDVSFLLDYNKKSEEEKSKVESLERGVRAYRHISLIPCFRFPTNDYVMSDRVYCNSGCEIRCKKRKSQIVMTDTDYDDSRCATKWEKKNGPILCLSSDLSFLDCDIITKDSKWKNSSTHPGCKMRKPVDPEKRGFYVFIGDENVDLFFSLHRSSRFWASTWAGLHNDNPHCMDYSSDMKAPFDHIDLSYITGADLLCIDIKKKSRKKYDEKIVELRGRLVQGLTSYFFDDQRKLSEKDLKDILSQALELGFHKKPWDEEIRTGIKMDVPKYMSQVCKKYEVDIPE